MAERDARWRGRFTPGLLDLYLTGLMLPPMAGSFAVTLTALLLYRVMDLIYRLSDSGGQLDQLLGLIGNLLPHYLGLAVPAAFFISIFLVIARLGDSSEIDALLGAGVSIDRLARPFLLMGVAIGAYSLILMGYVQPLSRYGYNLVMARALASTWDARVQPRTFVETGAATLTAEGADIAGRRLRGVFVRRRLGDGGEQVFTARTARLSPSSDGRRLTAVLGQGRQFQDRGAEAALVGTFDRLTVELELPGAAARFRPRGGDARELTLGELLARIRQPDPRAGGTRAASELYARLVRSISALLLPLLALPLGMAAKRGRRGPGLVVAGLILLIYEHAIDLGQALADLGHVTATAGVLGPFAIFGMLCLGLYAGSRRRPGESPFTLLLETLAELSRRARFRRLGDRPRPAPQA